MLESLHLSLGLTHCVRSFRTFALEAVYLGMVAMGAIPFSPKPTGNADASGAKLKGIDICMF